MVRGKANMETPLHKLAGREFRISSFEFRQAKPNKPKRLKTLSINNLTRKSVKQTQGTYLSFYQLVIAILGRIFERFGSSPYSSPSGIRERRCRVPTKPNKPNEVKTFVFNNMTEKSAKQTRRTYHACYQLLTAILGPIFRKFGWKRRGSLPGIGATPRARRYKQIPG
jgi:hypothetical protein